MAEPSVTIEWHGEVLAGRALDGGWRGLVIGAELVLQRSRAVVPNDEGTLERSGNTSGDRSTMTTAVSYDTPYAKRQHEVPMRHQDGRTDKYLERPWRASRDDIARVLQAQIRKALGT